MLNSIFLASYFQASPYAATLGHAPTTVPGQGPRPRRFQGCCLKDTVQGPQFEETKTHILNHAFLETSQNDS